MISSPPARCSLAKFADCQHARGRFSPSSGPAIQNFASARLDHAEFFPPGRRGNGANGRTGGQGSSRPSAAADSVRCKPATPDRRRKPGICPQLFPSAVMLPTTAVPHRPLLSTRPCYRALSAIAAPSVIHPTVLLFSCMSVVIRPRSAGELAQSREPAAKRGPAVSVACVRGNKEVIRAVVGPGR